MCHSSVDSVLVCMLGGQGKLVVLDYSVLGSVS